MLLFDPTIHVLKSVIVCVIETCRLLFPTLNGQPIDVVVLCSICKRWLRPYSDLGSTLLDLDIDFVDLTSDGSALEVRFAPSGCASRVLGALLAFEMRFALFWIRFTHSGCAPRILDALRASWRARSARTPKPEKAKPDLQKRERGRVTTLLTKYRSLNKNSPSKCWQCLQCLVYLQQK